MTSIEIIAYITLFSSVLFCAFIVWLFNNIIKTKEQEEHVWHVKVPMWYLLNKHRDWHEFDEDKRRFELQKLADELQHQLGGKIIITMYSEIYGVDFWAEKNKFTKLMFAIRLFFTKHTPFGFHIIKIK